MNLALGIPITAASAVALSWSFYAQHGATNALPELRLRHPVRSLRSLFTHRAWAAGFLVGIAGWGLYVLALRFAPISLVQALSAGGIGVLAVFMRGGGRRLSRGELTALGVCLLGLALLSTSLQGGVVPSKLPGDGRVLLWVAVLVIAGALAIRPGGAVLQPGAGFGIAAGLFYAAGDIASKMAVGAGAWLFVAVLLACHGFGFAALQIGFQRGTVLATAGLSTLLNNSVPIVAGLWLFGERLPAGVHGTLRVVSFALVVGGAMLLARPHD